MGGDNQNRNETTRLGAFRTKTQFHFKTKLIFRIESKEHAKISGVGAGLSYNSSLLLKLIYAIRQNKCQSSRLISLIINRYAVVL